MGGQFVEIDTDAKAPAGGAPAAAPKVETPAPASTPAPAAPKAAEAPKAPTPAAPKSAAP